MMIRCRRTAKLTPVSTSSLGVTGVIQAFVYDTILHREEMAVKGVDVLFCGPTEVTMIQNKVRTVLRAKGILFTELPIGRFVTYAETDVPDNEVLRSAAVDLIMRNNNTHSGRCLSGDRVVLAIDTQVFYQTNLTCDRKTNSDGFIGVLLHRPTKGAFGFSVRIVRQRNDINDLTTASAGGVFTESFCAGESELLGKGCYCTEAANCCQSESFGTGASIHIGSFFTG